uniref:Myb-like domain-containing protein n=1 Tax=Cajanus cajan TaxID=3821 RepID=A0A151SET0_CAJCA|nr:hypothetical protein KK1_024906 [Cajanus cajan]
MDGDDDPSALAWLWVVEALSACKKISPPTLQRMINSGPVKDEKLSETTRELVALRCLEEVSACVVDTDASSTVDSRVGFDFSRGCEDVLQETLGELIPLSKLKMAGAELLKWDVQPFVKHKRADTFKCHLEQLRESILEGTHPHTDYMKERSGLFPQNGNRIQHKISGTKPWSKQETDLQLEDPNGSLRQSASVKAPDHTENSCGVEISGAIVYQDIRPLNLSQKPVASDKTKVDMVNECGAELSSDGDGYHNEKNYFEARTESNEQNLCMKCNEGGQLLACKKTTCPLMVHKNCLGASAQLDAKGNFFCPFCAYSQAISEYLEAKKNASFAREELAIFISKGIQNQAAELVYDFQRQEHCFSRKSSKCEHSHVKDNENDQLTGYEGNREDQDGGHPNEANNLQFEKCHQQAPIPCIHSSCREKENVNNGYDKVLREEEIGEMPNAKSLTGGRVEETEVSTDHVDRHVGDKFTCEKTNIAPVNKSNAGEVPQEMIKQHNIDGTIEPVRAHDTGKEEISEHECETHSIPRYTMRFREHVTQCQFRRRKIPWTAEEEELIREGVKKFGLNDPKKWNKILAFGSCVFEMTGKRRTSQDLKDKWKNMCKAHSKSK